MADLYKFTFVDGTVLNLTSFNQDVVFNSSRYMSLGPRLNRGNIKWTQGLEVSEVELKIAAGSKDLANAGLTYQAAAVAGMWDGGLVRIDRVYFSNPPTLGTDWLPDGTFSADLAGRGGVNLFVGRVAEIDVARLNITLKLHSLTELLNIQMPRTVFEPSCRWALYSDGCTVVKSNYQVSGAVLAGSSNMSIMLSDMLLPGTSTPLPFNWLGLGSIQFTSGRLTGVSRTIRKHYTSGSRTYSSVVLNDGPMLYMRLGNNANDSTSNAYNGTVHGGVSFGNTGLIVGDAMHSANFDGSTGYIDFSGLSGGLPAANLSPGFGGFCIEFWLSPAVSTFVGVFDSGGAHPVRNFDYGRSTGGFEEAFRSPLCAPVSVTANQTHHVVVNFAGAMVISVYVDGVLSAGATSDQSIPLTWTNFVIGNVARISPTDFIQWYHGYLQEFAIYPYLLNEVQVADHYKVGINAPTNVAVAYAVLMSPLPLAPAKGDTFNAWAGCALDARTCNDKFNNVLNYGGFNAVPQPEVAL